MISGVARRLRAPLISRLSGTFRAMGERSSLAAIRAVVHECSDVDVAVRVGGVVDGGHGVGRDDHDAGRASGLMGALGGPWGGDRRCGGRVVAVCPASAEGQGG